jgi:hypothetical protein
MKKALSRKAQEMSMLGKAVLAVAILLILVFIAMAVHGKITGKEGGLLSTLFSGMRGGG